LPRWKCCARPTTNAPKGSTGTLADLYRRTGRVADALRLFVCALDLDRQVGNRMAEAEHICGHALAQLADGRAEQARSLWRQGADMLTELGYSRGIEQHAQAMRTACEQAGVPSFAH
jgi:hypothetical protein